MKRNHVAKTYFTVSLLIGLVVGFNGDLFPESDSKSHNGVRCRVYANGWLKGAGASWHTWQAWAELDAKLYARGHPVGYSVSGKYDVGAIIDAPGDYKKGSFTLTVKRRFKIFKVGDSRLVRCRDTGAGPSKYTPPGNASAKAKGHCGGANPKDVSWPQTSGSGSGGGG